MAPPPQTTPSRAETTGGCASSSSPSSCEESNRNLSNRPQNRRFRSRPAIEFLQFRSLRCTSGLTNPFNGFLDLVVGRSSAVPRSHFRLPQVLHVVVHLRLPPLSPGSSSLDGSPVAQIIRHGHHSRAPPSFLQKVSWPNSFNNRSISVVIWCHSWDDPIFFCRSPSLRCAQPRSVAASALPGPGHRSICFFPDRIAKWCGEIRQVLRMSLGKL
nr:uncharacterized protein LOC127300959 [Lolium perenne]